MGQRAKTSQFTVDDIGNPEPVVITIRCTRIVIAPADGSSNYLYRAPSLASTPVPKNSGVPLEIKALFLHSFAPGEIVCYVETASGVGAKTFNQEEHL